MNAETRRIYEAIITKSEQVKTLEAELKLLKASVIKYHDGQKLLQEDGFESVIKTTVRDTPQVKAIAERFGIEDLDFAHHPECFKRTEYDSVCVKRLVLG